MDTPADEPSDEVEDEPLPEMSPSSTGMRINDAMEVEGEKGTACKEDLQNKIMLPISCKETPKTENLRTFKSKFCHLNR